VEERIEKRKSGSVKMNPVNPSLGIASILRPLLLGNNMNPLLAALSASATLLSIL
jgi:hypothetical protein